MRTFFSRYLCFFSLFFLAISCSQKEAKDSFSFQFNGNDSNCGSEQPKIIKTTEWKDNNFIIHIKEKIECNLHIRKPIYSLNHEQINISYEVYSSGIIAKCYCSYNSTFSLFNLPKRDYKVNFSSTYVEDGIVRQLIDKIF